MLDRNHGQPNFRGLPLLTFSLRKSPPKGFSGSKVGDPEPAGTFQIQITTVGKILSTQVDY